MSEPKFTPGPWRFGVNRTPCGIKISLCRIDSANGTTVAQAAYLHNSEERFANAALITAAPDGYEYAETTAEVLRLLLETYKLPEQARKCLLERIDESEKYRKKARCEG